MITPELYATLEQSERCLWHSHVFEVKSGMLVMPQPSGLVPSAAWEAAETEVMKEIVTLYGKVYHTWQVDKGHKLPLGEPQLMTSYTEAEQVDFEKLVGERDKKFGISWERKKKIREGLESPEIHPGEFGET